MDFEYASSGKPFVQFPCGVVKREVVPVHRLLLKRFPFTYLTGNDLVMY
jgi:hypothetical protein